MAALPAHLAIRHRTNKHYRAGRNRTLPNMNRIRRRPALHEAQAAPRVPNPKFAALFGQHGANFGFIRDIRLVPVLIEPERVQFFFVFRDLASPNCVSESTGDYLR